MTKCLKERLGQHALCLAALRHGMPQAFDAQHLWSIPQAIGFVLAANGSHTFTFQSSITFQSSHPNFCSTRRKQFKIIMIIQRSKSATLNSQKRNPSACSGVYQVPTDGRKAKGGPGSGATAAGVGAVGAAAATGAAAGAAGAAAAGTVMGVFNGMYLKWRCRCQQSGAGDRSSNGSNIGRRCWWSLSRSSDKSQVDAE